jgi:hypothetical protein
MGTINTTDFTSPAQGYEKETLDFNRILIKQPASTLTLRYSGNKSTFPNDNAIFKVMYLAIRNASKKWTMPIRAGGSHKAVAIVFGERVPLF